MKSALLKPAEVLAAGSARVGGKAIGLARLARAGAQVPPWVVLSVEAFEAHLCRAGLEQRAADLLHIEPQDKEFGAAVRALQDAICEQPLDPEILRAIEGLASRRKPLAVRSSATDEDGASHSYAGIYTSYLYQHGVDQVSDAIRACWASAYSARALAYRRSVGEHGVAVGIGVIVQDMVVGDVSGVLFTRNPVTGSAGEVLISACWGLGAGVVDGSCNTDEFRVSYSGRELSAAVADKDTMVASAPGGGTQQVAVQTDRRGVRCLTAQQVTELTRSGLMVAEAFSAPQDIEWTICGGELILLQSRPITTAPALGMGDWQTVWDNSNIQESFSGVTLPLTFSWTAVVYRAIFRETLRLAGVPAKTIQAYDPVLRNMVGLMSGRVYYNINNWYRVLQLAPSFERRKDDVEKMIGLQDPIDSIGDQHFTQPERLRRTHGLVMVAIGLLFRLVMRRRSIHKFQAESNAELQRLRRACENAGDIRELLSLSEDLLQLFDRWAVPMLNDFFLGIQAGRVRRTIKRSGRANTDEVVAGLLAAQQAVESIEPTMRLMRIAARIQREERWTAVLGEGEPLAALTALSQFAPVVGAELDEFVELFGDRCIGESKLETISLRQDRSFLAKVLRNYVADASLDPEAFEHFQHQRQQRFETEVLNDLPWVHRWRLSGMLRSARDAVRSRESMRLTRTRMIGVARMLYTGIGEQLYAAGCLDDPRQVFYLSMDEIVAFTEGRAVTTRLAELARIRVAEFAEYADEDPPNQFETFGAPYLGRRLAPPAPGEGGDERVLRGVGCCPGVVEGQTQVVHSPVDDLNVHGKILVAVRTDPGWGPLFPGLAGLLVERGSTLSHSAVLARELGIPAVVGVPGLMATVTTGERVRLDGGSGAVWRLDGPPGEIPPCKEAASAEPGDISAQVGRLVSARLQISDVDADTPLIDYGLDSVRSVELLADVEAAFGVEIDDEQAAGLATVRDIVGYVVENRSADLADR